MSCSSVETVEGDVSLTRSFHRREMGVRLIVQIIGFAPGLLDGYIAHLKQDELNHEVTKARRGFDDQELFRVFVISWSNIFSQHNRAEFFRDIPDLLFR